MKIAPSILNADFDHLQAEIDSIATADRVHLDIMDGQYVPNTSFGVADLSGIDWPIPTEVHLMVDGPEAYFDDFQALGSTGITFHIENTGPEHALALLRSLQARDIRAGICIDDYTEPAALTDEVLNTADQVLVMSVKAGKGGQQFMPESIEKIRTLRSRGFTGEIEVDGGVNLDNVADLKEAGADIVVVGSFLMKKIAAERAEIITQFQTI